MRQIFVKSYSFRYLHTWTLINAAIHCNSWICFIINVQNVDINILIWLSLSFFNLDQWIPSSDLKINVPLLKLKISALKRKFSAVFNSDIVLPILRQMSHRFFKTWHLTQSKEGKKKRSFRCHNQESDFDKQTWLWP